MPGIAGQTRVCIVATPDSTATPATGLYETLRMVASLTAAEDRRDGRARPFEVEIVAERAGVIESASGLPLIAHRSVDEVSEADVVIVPTMEFDEEGEWKPGRYPRLVRWLCQMYEGGATVCAACTGGNLIAETGLLDGNEATVPWGSENGFRRRNPEVQVRSEEVLVISGDGGRLITSGAATAWHDLALFLIAEHVGPATAQAVARFNLWEWHRDGQAPYRVFEPPTDHGDVAVLAAQRGIAEQYAIASPVDEMTTWSGLAPTTFKRRFKAATGHTPIAYVQRIRVERAKRLLETSDESVEQISWAVGYEDPASFRRVFKRLTGLAPGAYRQRFRIPVASTRA
ncbi:MAG TPA: helix-turn-helix domain-containing protein [Solirubrobacterales bacterium]|nr:helix-turn-helix domain-containing protein [Solirubrobacterales bacterium]